MFQHSTTQNHNKQKQASALMDSPLCFHAQCTCKYCVMNVANYSAICSSRGVLQSWKLFAICHNKVARLQRNADLGGGRQIWRQIAQHGRRSHSNIDLELSLKLYWILFHWVLPIVLAGFHRLFLPILPIIIYCEGRLVWLASRRPCLWMVSTLFWLWRHLTSRHPPLHQPQTQLDIAGL